MACCKVCCGCAICEEGDQGKCCCGTGSSAVCCAEGEYCCNGECQAEPCAEEQCILMPGGCVWTYLADSPELGWYYAGAASPCNCLPSPCTCECVDPYLHCGEPEFDGQQCVTYCELTDP